MGTRRFQARARGYCRTTDKAALQAELDEELEGNHDHRDLPISSRDSAGGDAGIAALMAQAAAEALRELAAADGRQ